jgi:hypothetical protein
MHILKYKLLNVPIFIWGLQLVYVAGALMLFIVLLKVLNNKSSHLLFQIIYVVAMIIINITWRVAIKKLRPGWF